MILRLHGGLGNQLFQLLAGRYLSREIGKEIEIYTSDLANFKTKRDFEIRPLLKKEEKVIDTIRPVDKALFKYKVSKVLSNLGLHSIANVHNFSSWNGQYLNGYFQDIYNYKKLETVSEIVYSIEQSLLGLAPNNSLEQSLDYSSTCAIHVRLTDFIQHKKGEEFLRTYRIPYVLKSIEYFKKEFGIKKFVVFTDDLSLAKKLFNNEELIFFNDLGPTISLLQEFHLLSTFKYLITSNSTFSFWSSVMGGDKTIVFPSLWKHDDKKEDFVFKRNIELHAQMFPRNNFIKII
jgi:hypothetical protein